MSINTTFTLFSFGLVSLAFLVGLGLMGSRICRFRNTCHSSGPGSYIAANLPERVGKHTRKETRADVNWAVSIDSSEGVQVGVIRNVSIGGAFVCCKKPLPIGEVFRLTMIGPDGDPVMATAEVIWSNANLPSKKVINRGMGIRLTRQSDKHIRWVQQILFQQEGQIISPQ